MNLNYLTQDFLLPIVSSALCSMMLTQVSWMQKASMQASSHMEHCSTLLVTLKCTISQMVILIKEGGWSRGIGLGFTYSRCEFSFSLCHRFPWKYCVRLMLYPALNLWSFMYVFFLILSPIFCHALFIHVIAL